MDFWSAALDSLPGIIVGAVTIALGALLIWVGSKVWQKIRGPRPDFILRSRGGSVLELERTGRKIAFAVTQGDGVVIASSLGATSSPGWPLGDMKRGQVVSTRLPNETGSYVWFHWISGGSRYVTKSFLVEPKMGELEYFGKAVKLGQSFQT